MMPVIYVMVMNMKPNSINAPSHYTYKMVRHRLKLEGVNISRCRVYQLMAPGKALETETHESQRLIPTWRLLAYLDKRKSKNGALHASS